MTDRGDKQEDVEELQYNLKCLACGELIEVSVDPADLPSGPIPCQECGDESWKWSDAESFVDEHADDVQVAELIDDSDMEKLEPGSGGPLGNSTALDSPIVQVLMGPYLWLAFSLGTGVAAFIQQRPLMNSVAWGGLAAASFLALDRVQAKRQTGSWLGQPDDLN